MASITFGEMAACAELCHYPKLSLNIHVAQRLSDRGPLWNNSKWLAMKVQCCFNYFTFDEIKQVNEYVVEKSINTTAANFVKLF